MNTIFKNSKIAVTVNDRNIVFRSESGAFTSKPVIVDKDEALEIAQWIIENVKDSSENEDIKYRTIRNRIVTVEQKINELSQDLTLQDVDVTFNVTNSHAVNGKMYPKLKVNASVIKHIY